MLVKVLSLSFDSAYGGFNDALVTSFLKDKEVISIRDYFFIRNEIPYLALIIKYFPYREEVARASPVEGQPVKKDEEWRGLLTESDMGLFNILRDWRSQRCKKEGLPPYILFTNGQLAQIVKNRPQSLPELMKIDGIGKAKVEKYGNDILNITKIEPISSVLSEKN